MQNTAVSISAGALLGVVTKISAAGIMDCLVYGLVGGAAGYLGKVLVEWAIKRLKQTKTKKQ